jgi:hypothetical protein
MNVRFDRNTHSGISEDPFFKDVRLGKFQNQLRNRLLISNPGDKDCFSIIITKYNFENNKILCPPHRVKLKGINGYKYYLFNSLVFIKVDSKKLKLKNSLFLSEDLPLMVSILDPPDIISRIQKIHE